MNWITSNKWRTATIALIIVIVLVVYFLIKGKSDYKSLETDFKAKQDTINIKNIEILQWQKYGLFWHSYSDSLDREIVIEKSKRKEKKEVYVKKQNSVDLYNDPQIDSSFDGSVLHY